MRESATSQFTTSPRLDSRAPVQIFLAIILLAYATPASCFSNPGRIRIRPTLHPPAANKAKILHQSHRFSPCTRNVATRASEDSSLAEEMPNQEEKLPGIWPCFDALDSRLIGIAGPIILNFAIAPLIGAVDLFWINRMGNALAVAGQAAANQVFNSAFWLASFLPSVTATFVSTENAAGNQEGVQDAICQAMFVGMLFAFVGALALLLQPDRVLSSVLKRK